MSLMPPLLADETLLRRIPLTKKGPETVYAGGAGRHAFEAIAIESDLANHFSSKQIAIKGVSVRNKLWEVNRQL